MRIGVWPGFGLGRLVDLPDPPPSPSAVERRWSVAKVGPGFAKTKLKGGLTNAPPPLKLEKGGRENSAPPPSPEFLWVPFVSSGRLMAYRDAGAAHWRRGRRR